MVTFHDGDLLKTGCNVICHQVNLQGVMGGGLAYQIAKKYPECANWYKTFLDNFGTVAAKSTVCMYQIESRKHIANCFTQDENFNTNYEWLRKALNTVKEFASERKYTVGLPFNYGCGIAKGDWKTVLSIIQEVFGQSQVECQIWRLV
jgi:O-acetyl-ADP-ribose deacetylase (regulator of RNase III)